jgi:GMP synthase-like glutamine amidotransferase
MIVYTYEHAPFEGPGAIAEWAAARGRVCVRTDATAGELPVAGSGDLLVVMGGPQSAADPALDAYFAPEKRAIAAAIEGGAAVFGVCLGAQLTASVLGADVTRNPEPEVGWYEVVLTREGAADPVFGTLPERFVAGHWHQDTFGIPEGAVRTLSSEACPNQGFSAHGGRVIGLQCHLEWGAADVRALVDEFGDSLVPHGWVVSDRDFLAGESIHGANTRPVLYAFLDALETRAGV